MNDSGKYQVSRWVKILFWTLIPLGSTIVTVTLITCIIYLTIGA